MPLENRLHKGARCCDCWDMMTAPKSIKDGEVIMRCVTCCEQDAHFFLKPSSFWDYKGVPEDLKFSTEIPLAFTVVSTFKCSLTICICM